MKKKTLKFAFILDLYGFSFANAPAGYEVQTIDLPDVKQFNVAGLVVHKDGTVYFATREGEIWKRSNDKWSLYAQGLHEPCGLKVVDHKNIIVSQKPELTKVIDRNGDGIGDRYENVTDDFGFFGNYHEFHYGPIMDEEGNLFATLNLQTNGFRYQDKALAAMGVIVVGFIKSNLMEVSSPTPMACVLLQVLVGDQRIQLSLPITKVAGWARPA